MQKLIGEILRFLEEILLLRILRTLRNKPERSFKEDASKIIVFDTTTVTVGCILGLSIFCLLHLVAGLTEYLSIAIALLIGLIYLLQRYRKLVDE